MSDFYYRTSADTLWIGTAEHPALARFGRRGFEVHAATPQAGAALLAQPIDGDPLKAWRDFVAALAALDIKITGAHAPADILKLLPPAEHEPPKAIPLARLICAANPYEIDVWGVGPLARDEVAAAIAAKAFVSTPFHAETRLTHTRRVAYLAMHPETWAPVSLECGPTAFEVIDGYHRLAAAIFRGDKTIAADLDGFESAIRRLTAA